MKQKMHAVGVIFQSENGDILVLRRHPLDPEGKRYGLVGGKVEEGEMSEQAATREVKEEIRHDVNTSDLMFLRSYHWDREDMDIYFDVFKLLVSEKDVVIDLDKNENTQHMWSTPTELYKRKDLMIGLYPILKDEYKI